MGEEGMQKTHDSKEGATNNENSNCTYPVKRKKLKRQVEPNDEVPAKQIVMDRIEDNDTLQSSPTTEKKPSKRQIKKEKAEQRGAMLKDKSRSDATEKALNYVSKWKHSRSNWKFEKLRQIWLMDHLLEEKSIPDAIFPIVLEYFEGSKGMAREQLIKKGMVVIKVAEEEETKEEVTNSVAYIRARELIQVLSTKS